jgi:signal transduction histidine kinase/CheY-like chemotaxis protein
VSTVAKKNKISRVFMLAGMLLVFIGASMALVSFKVGYWPWELRWLDADGIASPIMMIVLEDINEFAALGISSLLLALFAMIGYREKPETVTSVVDTQAIVEEDETSGEADSLPVIEAPKQSDKSIADRNRDAQLQIALSEITRLKKDLVISRRETESAEKVKSQFLSNMSHELRTPMNGIMGMTDLILDGKLSKQQRHFAQSINASSESLLSVINDLLDFSRIESGDMQLDSARFDFGACAEEVCGMLAASAHSKGVELICYVDEDMPRYVIGDATRLRQVLNNLVSNSIAFTNEGEIVVRLSCIESSESHHVFQCDVQDTGAGIAPELQATMFESFSQADQSSTRQHGGLGIGLAITHQLVALMGGKVTFRSRLGEGTRFTFTGKFERVSDEDAGRPVGSDYEEASVLIVDDNDTNRSILFHQISAWGYTVELAESGSQALEILNEKAEQEQNFDAVILDLHMPNMDGLELAREIRKIPAIADIKAMMLTSAIVDI